MIKRVMSFALVVALAGCVDGCSSTPADVLREADGVEGVPGSAITERAMATMDIYNVFAGEAADLLETGQVPPRLALGIIKADEAVASTALRLEPIAIEFAGMQESYSEGDETRPRWVQLACMVPRMTRAIAQGIPELKARLQEAGEGEAEIPLVVAQAAVLTIEGACPE